MVGLSLLGRGVGPQVHREDTVGTVGMVGMVGMVSTAWGLVQVRNRPSTGSRGLAAAGHFLGGNLLRGLLLRGELRVVGRRWACPSRIRCSRPSHSSGGHFGRCLVVPWHPLQRRSERRVRE